MLPASLSKGPSKQMADQTKTLQITRAASPYRFLITPHAQVAYSAQLATNLKHMHICAVIFTGWSTDTS